MTSALVQEMLETQVEQAKRARIKHPTGWEPGVEEFGDGTATAVSQPSEDESLDETALIVGWKLDPDEWMIVGPVNCRRWQTYDERWLYYYKANLVRRNGAGIVDYDDLIEEVKTAPLHPSNTFTRENNAAFVVCIADTQFGKPDGDGVKGTVDRFLADIESVARRAQELRDIGRGIPDLYVLGLGDIIEGCADHYAMQTFGVELNRRDQVKLARRLIVRALRKWAPMFDRVVVAAIGGNHGENRKDGKSFTDFADNDDVAIFEQIQEIFAENEDAFGHVRFVVPNDQLDITLDIGGTITTIAHGHQARSGADPRKKQMQWWKDQAHGMRPAGESTLLLTGHYHHLAVIREGQKTHIQAPALEGSSDWWVNMTGQTSPPGMLTLVVGSECEFGWQDLEVL